MQWFRMYGEFLTDPKVQMLSEEDQRRYIMLLCFKCCNGDVTFQDEEVTFQLRISNDQWRETKHNLINKNLITEDNQPTQWNKRQYVSDTSSERVRKHREKKKLASNVSVTTPDTETETETEICRFDEFWNTFSDKRGKDGALRVWNRKKLNRKADEVISGAKAYVKSRGEERKYWKQAQGWLNDGRWEDEVKVDPTEQPKKLELTKEQIAEMDAEFMKGLE